MPSRDDARAALEEIMAKGRVKQRQEPWVALGGRLLQGKRNLSYEEIRELAERDAKKRIPSGYANARSPHRPESERERRKSA